MSERPAIRVCNLGKKYRLGGPVEKYSTIRDTITNSLKSRFKSGTSGDSKDFWALKNVTFDVEQGEIVGIIGRNGAGKSTLLKILARITTPTEGTVELYGRVGSLLEIGTGFHPELTGRENIFLSGSIHGMRRKEIEARFDEIVKFSEIEKFLDVPVKRYSSGMYVRLAFAVAAHLEPEILLIDEVLAVGDAAFQKKCLGKMGEVAKEGRTVLFVSHNMAAIQNLCTRTFLLREGKVVKEGTTVDIISDYLSWNSHACGENGAFHLDKRNNLYNNGIPIIKKVLFLGQDNFPRNTFLMGEPLRIGILVDGLSTHKGSHLGVVFKSDHDQWVSTASTWMTRTTIEEPRNRIEWVILDIAKLNLTPGIWGLYVSCTIHGTGMYLDKIEDGISFTVEGSDYYGTGHLISKYYGLFCMDFNWKIVHEI